MSRVDDLDEDRVLEVTWLEILLVVSVGALTIQLFPGIFTTSAEIVWMSIRWVLSYCDVRQWTWRSYAVANALAFVGLGVIRLWKTRE